ncbi:MAG TPA: phosphatidate cytidylyltransferase [Steroidobacteraceae bacterium]|nr:phosphatidate cytidylyltransferase [Steroidobacteraceae bacterium]
MLKERIRTALILGALLIVVLFALPVWAAVAVITLALLAGAWEWSALIGRSGQVGIASRLLFVVAIAAGMAALALPEPALLPESTVLAIAVLWWLAGFTWVVLAPGKAPPPTGAIAGVLTLVPAWYALLHLRLDFTLGAEWLLYILVLVTAADSGAYFVGRRFGRVKLAPRVSPGKTWEGVFGGLAAGCAAAWAGALWFGLPALPFLALALAVIVFGIVGDLVESQLKRAAGVKDSGTLFPGHGGMLDRIDSLTAAAPVLLAGLHLLGVS